MSFLSKSHTQPESYLRFFHAFAQPISLDVYLDDLLLGKDYLYEDFSPFFPISIGEHHIRFCDHATEEVFYERNLWISKHKIYTLVLSLALSEDLPQGYLLNEPHKAIPEEHFLLRTANFSQVVLPSTLYFPDIKPLYKKVPLRQSSSYLAFLPLTSSMDWILTSTQEVLLSSPPMTFKPTRYYTLYLVGGTDAYPLKCIQTIDGNAFLHFD